MKIRVYLAGSMEYSSDLGAGWRDKVTEKLSRFGVDVLNPCLFETDQLKGLRPNQLPEKVTHKITKGVFRPTHWHQLKNAVEPHLRSRFLRYMRRIIQYDVKILKQQADYVIVYWDEATGKGAGSHAELTVAYLRNIPIFCVNTVEMPAWADACCTERFDNFEELYRHLDEEFGER